MRLSRGDVTLVLLAGGYNTRLRRTDSSLPKSLLPLPDVGPVMVGLADQFVKDGAQVIVTFDYLAAKMFELLYPALRTSVQVVEDDFAGTGQALRMGVEAARTRWVIVANADTVVPVDLTTWYRTVELDGPIHQLLVPDSVQNSGLIGVDPHDGKVVHWGETDGRTPASHLRPASSTGVYLLHRSTWLGWSGRSGVSLEREILPEAVAQGLLHGTIASTQLPVFDYGTVSRLHELAGNDRLRHQLLAAANLIPKGPRCTPPSFSSEPRATSDNRPSLAASGATN
ncbi:nucleotidyltransferase family protein [Kribbella sp. CWNU-51]